MFSVTDIDALLPQTQCGECGFAGCMPYAKAMADGTACIDRCPPGGVATLTALGKLLQIDPLPYVEKVEANYRVASLAVIREADCIGCTKCIQACPVDAILGSAKSMHTIISHECTGCGLCVEPCPVDCIDMVDIPSPEYSMALARARHQAKQDRLQQVAEEKQASYREKRNQATQPDRQAFILEAIARANAKLNSPL